MILVYRKAMTAEYSSIKSFQLPFLDLIYTGRVRHPWSALTHIGFVWPALPHRGFIVRIFTPNLRLRAFWLRYIRNLRTVKEPYCHSTTSDVIFLSFGDVQFRLPRLPYNSIVISIIADKSHYSFVINTLPSMIITT
jgi:hypothetical protein